MAMSSGVAWGTVERCFVWLGKVFRGIEWFGDVLFGAVGFIGALHGMAWSCKALSRLCEALIDSVVHSVALHGLARRAEALFWQGGVEQSDVLNSDVSQAKVLSRRGVVWSREALNGIVKFGPMKHCYARFSKLHRFVARFGNVKWCLVSQGRVWVAFSRSCVVNKGSVGRGAAKCSRARLALALLRRGQVWLGTVLPSKAWYCEVSSRFGRALLGFVMRSPVRLGSVKRSFAMRGTPRLGVHGYGGYQK